MMREYETKYLSGDYDYIIGTDEAGRGPMAGELVVAGVMLPNDYQNELINDSKKLTARRREILYDQIIENALAFHVEVISIEAVDRLNVYQASKIGMERCVAKITRNKTFVLSDAMPLDNCDHEAIIKGDAKSISIAAASILAKVTRDRLMEQHALEYPQYGFEKHKGYVTKAHKEALAKFGVSPLHRLSFKPVQEQLDRDLEK